MLSILSDQGKANQNDLEILPHTIQDMVTRMNIPPLLVGVQICKGTLEFNLAVSQKIGTVLLQDPTIPFLVHPKDVPTSHKNT